MIELFPSRTVAIDIFGFSVHWYGLLYLAAFLIALKVLPVLQKERDLQYSNDDWARILAWSVIGVIVGGRLGFVLFYQPEYYLLHPLEIIQVWRGGMSSHGGMIGVAIALFSLEKKMKLDLWRIGDIAVIPIAIGLALGRIGNFINWELYGTVTDLPWAMAIPGVDGLRHPTFFYAAAKDLFIAAVCYVHLTHDKRVGTNLGLFFILYGLLRFAVEYARVQPHGMVDLGIATISRGQLLTIPVILIGVWIWGRSVRRS